MKQVEIEFFYPLTEQVVLDLDFTRCEEYQRELRAKMFAGSVIATDGSQGQFYLAVGSNVASGFVIDRDSTPFTIRSEKKPNIIQRMVYRALGLKWEVK